MSKYDAMTYDELLQAEDRKKEPRHQPDLDVSFEGLQAMNAAQERWEAEMARIQEAKPPALRHKRRIEREQRRP